MLMICTDKSTRVIRAFSKYAWYYVYIYIVIMEIYCKVKECFQLCISFPVSCDDNIFVYVLQKEQTLSRSYSGLQN